MQYNCYPSSLRRSGYAGALALLLSLISAAQALAQNAPLYANRVISKSSQLCREVETTTPLGTIKVMMCGNGVTNPERAVDNDFNSSATLTNALALSGSTTNLRVSFPRQVPAGYRTGIVVSNSKRLTEARIVGFVRLLTYDKGSSTPKEIISVSPRVVSAAVLSTTPVRMEFTARFAFDELEIEAESLLDVAPQANQDTGLQLHYAYGVGSNVVEQASGVLSRLPAPTARDYSTTSKATGIVDVCVNSNVENPRNAVDADLTNYATLGSTLGVSCAAATLQVQLEGKAEAGYQAGFIVSNSGLLNAEVLRNLRVTTYLGRQPQESVAGIGLLEVTLLSNGQYQISFPSTKAFDRTEIEQSSLTSAFSGLRVYYGFGIEPRAFRDLTPILSNNIAPKADKEHRTESSSLVCLKCGINNPEKAADATISPNDYAVIMFGGQLAGTQSLNLRLREQPDATGKPVTGKAGDRAGVVVGNGGPTGELGLLDVSALSNMTVTTYSGLSGRTPVESASGSSILDLKTLADGRSEVSFLTTQDFDWVELKSSNTLGLLNNTRAYYAFADQQPVGFPSKLIAPGQSLPVELVSLQGKVVGPAVELSWQTASEQHNSHFVVERATGSGAKTRFEPVGRVAGQGTSTSRHHYIFRDEAPLAAVGYYRLRQVDVDGKEIASPVVAVRWTPALAQAGFEIYPNPAAVGEVVMVRLPAAPAAGQALTAYDTQGREVYRGAVADGPVSLAASGLQPGLYQVVLNAANGQRLASQRLVIGR